MTSYYCQSKAYIEYNIRNRPHSHIITLGVYIETNLVTKFLICGGPDSCITSNLTVLPSLRAISCIRLISDFTVPFISSLDTVTGEEGAEEGDPAPSVKNINMSHL